jgi:hypothetical protein
MREYKTYKDYVEPIRKELKEKHGMDIPAKKISQLLYVFNMRIKEALYSKHIVYINDYLYFSFNFRKEINFRKARIRRANLKQYIHKELSKRSEDRQKS